MKEFKKPTNLELNPRNHPGSLVANRPKFLRKPVHSKYPVSGVEVGAAISTPSPGKPTVQSASMNQCAQGVAGTWRYLGLYNPAAGHDAGGTGQGLGPPGLP